MLRSAGIEASDAHAFDYIETGIAAAYHARFGVTLEAVSA
jgi:hypothetical protein